MLYFDIITIFPEIFDSYFKESIIKRAQIKKLIKINIHNLRDYTTDKHKTVDDKPYGGGPGMIFKVEPIFKAVAALKKCKIQMSKSKSNPKSKCQKIKTILFSAKGKKFNQKMAQRFSKLDRIILICGHYEGVDERVAKHIADEEISIGDYILTGGELPAMLLVDAITRLRPGVIKKESLKEESFSSIKGLGTKKSLKIENLKFKILKEYPQYTRPEVFEPRTKVKWKVPKVLVSGNHQKIKEWKEKYSKIIEK